MARTNRTTSKQPTVDDAPSSTIVATFALERETKNAVRYQELDADGEMVTDFGEGAIGALYIRKTALGAEPYPPRVRATIERLGDA